MTIGEQWKNRDASAGTIDKKRFSTSAPHGRCDSLHQNGGVPGYDLLRNQILKISKEVAVTIASGRIYQSRTVRG